MLWCYADRQGWGADLHAAARRRGLPVALFRRPEQVKGGVAFVHMHHHPRTRDRDKQVMVALARRGVPTIPEPRSARLYDDKVAQAIELARWLPETTVLHAATAAEREIGALGFPFMSKAAEGAGSHNVRLVADADAARAEISLAFGPGIPLRYDRRQHGYLLWQRFCPGNDHDYRVIRIGDQRLMLRRFNRPDRPMASGSGDVQPVNRPDGEAAEALALANLMLAAEDLRWCGVDLVRDADGAWRVLEVTVGWTLGGYHDCVFLGDPRGRTGHDVWDVTLDELEAGRLGVPS